MPYSLYCKPTRISKSAQYIYKWGKNPSKMQKLFDCRTVTRTYPFKETVFPIIASINKD